MSIESIFQISGSGMDFQMMRVQAVTNNLANMNVTSSTSTGAYKPVIATAKNSIPSGKFSALDISSLNGVEDYILTESTSQPKSSYIPDHPDADANGYVYSAAINPIEQMTTLIEASRAYEANIQALNVTKTLIMKSMEIGK